jgi:hypothetical protein
MANETAQPAPVPEGTAELGAAQRLGGVFFSPGATFRSIARSPGFWPPLIVFIVVNLAGWQVVVRKIGLARVAAAGLAMSGRTAGMTEAQREQAVRVAEKISAISYPVGSIVGPFIVFLILALLGLAILKAIFGQQLKFKTAYSVAAYAFMPNLIAVLLGMATAAFGDPSAFNAANPAPTNLGFFLSPQSVSHALYTGATSLDILSFWTMVLLGIGFSEAVGRKASSKGVFLSFFVLWVLFVLLKMGLALI